jgi:hypothetical protein
VVPGWINLVVNGCARIEREISPQTSPSVTFLARVGAGPGAEFIHHIAARG